MKGRVPFSSSKVWGGWGWLNLFSHCGHLLWDRDSFLRAFSISMNVRLNYEFFNGRDHQIKLKKGEVPEFKRILLGEEGMPAGGECAKGIRRFK